MKYKMRINLQIIILSTLVLFIGVMPPGAFAETGKRPDESSALKGKAIFETYCQSCHGKTKI